MNVERSISTPNGEVQVRLGSAAEIVELRHAVLRFGLPRESAMFPGDDRPDSRHVVAATEAGRVVGCATFHASDWKGSPAWRLRGMATAPEFRSMGLGTAMLRLAENVIRTDTPIHTLWCNARVPATEFYKRNGWTVESDVFDIPTAGPHVIMTKQI